MNDAAYFANKPLVDGAILLFDGQATVYIPEARAATAACSRPAPTGRGRAAPRLVLGAITGIVGSIQATEVMG